MKIQQIFLQDHPKNRHIDNSYFYVIYDEQTQEAIAFDPGCPAVIDEFLESKDLRLKAIFNTHHHGDHVGGNEALHKKYNCPVYGSKYDQDRIPKLTHGLEPEQDKVSILGLEIEVLDLKAHTKYLVGYYIKSLDALFPGDAIFSVGCGRLFEGNPQDLLNSFDRMAKLPEDTQIYCSHEYTLQNIKFAKTIDKSNEDLVRYEKLAQDLLEQNTPTVPCLLKRELLINPYFRSRNSGLQKKHKQQDPALLLGHFRSLKDQF